jgi:hypothetical protein
MNELKALTGQTLPPAAVAACDSLNARVETVKHRHRFSFLGRGACLVLAVVAAIFLAFSAADILFKLSVGSRVFAALAALLSCAGVLAWAVVRPWRREGGPIQVARSVEKAHPELEDQLSTALEYARTPLLTDKTSSPALVGALIQHAARRSEPVDFTRTVRWRPVLIAALGAFVLVLGVAAYRYKNPRLFNATLARFTNPTADIKAPTLTNITHVEPGNAECQVVASVLIEVTLDGRLPDKATLAVFVGGEKDGRWEDRLIERDEEGRYRATLRRVLDNTRYKIKAGDDESEEYRLDVFRIPEIVEFAVRVEYPAYTGKAPETLSPGTGDVRALKGSTVRIDLKANTDLADGEQTGRVVFKSGRAAAAVSLDPADRRKASATFKLEGDDEYQVQIASPRGKTGSGSRYLLKALADRHPRVVIRKPDHDVSAPLDGSVIVEISAEDDVGVTEIGLFHTVGVDEKKVLVRKPDGAAPRLDGKLVWELGNLGLASGEVISYHAYAIDNDTVDGPKMAKSDIHFLTIFTEQNYDGLQSTEDKKKGAPPALKQLDKLLDIQKKILQETFNLSRQDEKTKAMPPEDLKNASQKAAAAQKDLRNKLTEMVRGIKEELAKADGKDGKDAKPGDDSHKGPGFGSKEIEHLEQAVEKMSAAEEQLNVPKPGEAVKPETEALRQMSETRRLILSDKKGDPRFKNAMESQAKKKKQQEQSQEAQDQQQAKEELSELPKMLEQQKKVERELEELEARKKKNPPPPPGQTATSGQKKEQDEQRRLEREMQQKLDELAKQAKDRARRLEQLAQRREEMRQAADKLRQAADKSEQASNEAKQNNETNLQEAKEKTKSAQNDTKDAQRSLRNAMEKQLRQEIGNLQKDAQELAQRQQELAQQAAKEQEQKDSPAPSAESAKNDDKAQSAKQPDGKDPSGKQSAQAQGGTAQKLRSMAGEQGDIAGDLKELGERLEKLTRHAQEKNLAGAQDMEQALRQARGDSPASQAAQNAAQAMAQGKSGDAQREAAKASKAMEQMAQTLQESMQKTAAGDMKDMANALKSAQNAAREQADINKDMAGKRDPAQLAQRESKIVEAAKDLASAADKLDPLRRQGRDGSAKDRLEEAAKQAADAAEALKGQDAVSAKTSGENAEKALNQAAAEMERAVGKTLEDQAKEAKSLARSALDKQEKSTDAAKKISTPQGDEKQADRPLDAASSAKRDEAARLELDAARDAKRLEHALEGLQSLAKDANPAAAEAARETREGIQQNEAPKAMDKLADDVAKLGKPKKDGETVASATPAQAVKKGEELAQVLRKAEKGLDGYIAEASGSQLDRLRSMESTAREAMKIAQDLAKQESASQGKPTAQGQPDTQGKPGTESGQNPGRADKLARELKRLQAKIERLEPNAPEGARLREAMDELKKSREQSKAQGASGDANKGGASFSKAARAMDEIVSGLVTRIERILRLRDIRTDTGEEAPKEYRALVEKYYRALSEDVEER